MSGHGRDTRSRQATLADDLDRLSDAPTDGSAGAVLVTTTVSSYPTTAAAVYACNPVLIAGDETEGATPTFTADTLVVIYAPNLGTAVPPPGTYVIGHGVGGRWVFRHDG